jgi:hypothetical protein
VNIPLDHWVVMFWNLSDLSQPSFDACSVIAPDTDSAIARAKENWWREALRSSEPEGEWLSALAAEGIDPNDLMRAAAYLVAQGLEDELEVKAVYQGSWIRVGSEVSGPWAR